MKKFFVALTILLAVTGVNLSEAAQFTDEQRNQMVTLSVQPSAATLKVNVATFRQNFNNFMSDFIAKTNAGEETAKLQQIFLIDEKSIVTNGQNVLFAKSFANMVAVIGSVDENGNFKTLNLFGAPIDDKNDAMIHALVLNAFVKGISPDLDAQTILTESKDHPDTPIVKGDVKISFATAGDLDVVSVAAK